MRSRRHLLQVLAAAGVGSVAGCSIAGPPDDVTTDQPADAPTDTATPTHTATPQGDSQSATLLGPDRRSGDKFGWDVSLADDGTTVLVGAPGHGDIGEASGGKAVLFGRSKDGWHHRATLIPDDRDAADQFGYSVALSGTGDTVLVGAPGDRDVAGEDKGSAYLFERADDDWRERAKFAPDDRDPNLEVGVSVGLSASGDLGVIGATNPFDDHSGEVYPYALSEGEWSQEGKFEPDSDENWDSFGGAVSMAADGSRVLVGATGGQDFGNLVGTGFVFERAGGAWRQAAALEPPEADAKDGVGAGVALVDGGRTALLGAPNEESSGYDSGRAFVFRRSGGNWEQTGTLAPSDGDSGDEFGAAVAMSADGSAALVGAPVDEDPNGPNAGSAYLFALADGDWRQRAKLRPETTSMAAAGQAVALAGDGRPAYLGAPGDKDDAGDPTGSLFVFE